MRPGLEVKLACEAAEETGAHIHFIGNELDTKTWDRLHHETRFNITQYMIRVCQYANTLWYGETITNKQKLQMVGPSAFSEECCD